MEKTAGMTTNQVQQQQKTKVTDPKKPDVAPAPAPVPVPEPPVKEMNVCNGADRTGFNVKEYVIKIITERKRQVKRVFDGTDPTNDGKAKDALTTDIKEITYVLGEILKWYKENTEALVECRAPINVCGDTHGQLYDLIRIFNSCGSPTRTKYLFLGDYIDRGRHSVNLILLLFALKLSKPRNVNLLRGNHELKAINKNYGFYAELRARCEGQPPVIFEELYNKFNEVFTWMPLAGIINGKILCMHGGISPHLNSLDDIRKIPLPLESAKKDPLACDLLWADPDIGTETFQYNKTRAISHIFGEKQVNDICAKLNIDMIIRAHQVVEFGYAFFANKRLITVFSASRYQEEMQNYAGVVRVDKYLEVSFCQLKPEDYENRRDENDTDDKFEQRTGSGPGGC